MPIDHVLPNNLDDLYGPGADQADMIGAHEAELEELEGLVREELDTIIGNFADDKKVSTISGIQPPESVIQAMAQAAASVLMAFERGYRMGD